MNVTGEGFKVTVQSRVDKQFTLLCVCVRVCVCACACEHALGKGSSTLLICRLYRMESGAFGLRLALGVT